MIEGGVIKVDKVTHKPIPGSKVSDAMLFDEDLHDGVIFASLT